MKGVLVLSVFLASLAAVVCRPQISYKDATIIDQNNNFNGIDPWKWNYQSSDGTSRVEEGSLAGDILEVRGSYSWTAPDGSAYIVTYQAGKDGYIAQTQKGSGAGVQYGGGFGAGAGSSALGGFGGGAGGAYGGGLGVNTQLSLIG